MGPPSARVHENNRDDGAWPDHGLAGLLRRWRLTLEAPPVETPSGVVGFVRRDAARFVLKLPRPGGDEVSAVDVLTHFGGDGAVRVLDRGPGGAVLLERAMPGDALTGLVLAGDDDGATAVICSVAAALHRRPAPVAAGVPRVEDWACGFAWHRAAGDARVPAALVDRASALYAILAATQDAPRLLHGDLHHDNVLRDAGRGWLAIDPKGVVGEPAYEIGAALRNPTTDPARFAVTAVADRRAWIAAGRLGLDRQRVLGWGFALAVLSAIWCVQDGLDPARGLAAAAAIRPLM
jgi:streptomycin 6-kinase